MQRRAPTVLIVDDEPPVRYTVRRMLEGEGYRLMEAAGPEAALALVEASDGAIDLLLTDLAMPGMDGIQLARAIRERHPQIRVLYLTGFADRLFQQEQVLTPAEAFLEKPTSRDGLRQAVSLLLFGALTPPPAEPP